MKNVNAIVFIDANQYLNLYRVAKGKKLLAPLIEQGDYIFVTEQIVHEIQRNKLQIATGFLRSQFEQLKLRNFEMPDHLISRKVAADVRAKIEDIAQRLKQVNTELEEETIEILQRVSRSEDEVSKALSAVLGKAIKPTPEELARARQRKEIGNPPGKKADPLGDQLTWEQLLNHSRGIPRIWIISGDSDYYTKHCGKTFLNPLLCQDFEKMNQSTPEVRCFDDIDAGLRDFVGKTGVKAKKFPTLEESNEIRKEIESLLPIDWLTSNITDAANIAVQAHLRQLKQAAAAIGITVQDDLSSWCDDAKTR